MKTALATLALLVATSAFAADIPAFPGAEGFGAKASGGRGGEVYEVTNLADSGPGSLRDGVSKPNRTIVFRISGTIDLKSALKVSVPNITIAGQTAPGDGICLRGHELFIEKTDNVIVRYLRIRPGDEAKKEMDACTIWTATNVILDHCSMSWSTDSLNDVVKQSGYITVQWCILAEPLVHSVHSKGSHGYATGWDGRVKDKEGAGGSFHHNLIAHAASRAPRIGYFKEGRGLIDCRNNVIYNSGNSYGGETDDFNYVGNYYRPGPNTAEARKTPGVMFDSWSADSRIFFDGNVYEGLNETPIATSLVFKGGNSNLGQTPAGTLEKNVFQQPFAVPAVTTHSAKEAYELVTAQAGARLPKIDAVDERILNDVKNRTGKFIDTPSDVGGYPELKSAPAPVDTDHDGIPDDYEKANNLNPNDPKDGAAITASGYSNLEVYLNFLVK